MSVVLVSVVLALEGFGGALGQFLEMCPLFWQWKHLPSDRRRFFSSSVSFLKGIEVVASMSIAFGSFFGRFCPTLWVGPKDVVPGPALRSFHLWASFLAADCHWAIVIGMVSRIRQALNSPFGSPFLKNSTVPGASLSHPAIPANRSNRRM